MVSYDTSIVLFSTIPEYLIKIIMEAKTKSQIAKQLGLSLRTLQRRLTRLDLKVPRGLLTKEQQTEILLKLGFSNEGETKANNTPLQ